MRKLVEIEVNDFVLLREPDSQPDPVPNEAENSPNEKSIKELFDCWDNSAGIKYVINLFVKYSLPFQIAWWSFLVAVIGLYNNLPETLLLTKLSENNRAVMESHNQRLKLVDEKLSSIRRSFELNKTFEEVKTTVKSILMNEPYTPHSIYITRGVYVLALYLLLQYIFPRLRHNLYIGVPTTILTWILVELGAAVGMRVLNNRRKPGYRSQVLCTLNVAYGERSRKPSMGPEMKR